jgi:uncharacterized membrane protein
MKNYRFFLAILLVLISIVSKAQLLVKNSTDEVISISVGWYSESKQYFVTKGWYNVNPGETINPGMTFTSNDDYFFYYAKGYEGTYKMLVANGSAFQINDANNQSEKLPSYDWVLFKKKEVHFDFLQEKKYTLNLTSGDSKKSNENFKIQANLIFDDGTLSDFNLIDNSNIALWNTIIGEGSAGKPSNKTKFSVTIPQKNSNIEIIVVAAGKTIYNSGKIDTSLKEIVKKFEVKTGCDELTISIKQNGKELMKKQISFQCGE